MANKDEIPQISPTEKMVDISKAKDGGLYKEILKEGEGSRVPGIGNTVRVHYVGTLLDGEKFDSSRDRQSPFEFKLGKKQVIPGWDEGVATMRIGEKSVLTCRSDYAYGEAGSPPKIPPNAILKFEVELLGFEGDDVTEKKDGGVMKSTITAVEGESFDSARFGAQLKVHIKGIQKGSTFDERDDVSFILGEGGDHNIPWGVELTLANMKKGEKSQALLKPEYGFTDVKNIPFKIDASSELEYEVEIKDMENTKENWEMEIEEKISQSEIIKEKGTALLKKNSLSAAYKHYKRIVDYLHDAESSTLEEPRRELKQKLLLAGYLNCAHCELKLKDYELAIEHCTSVIELDADNEKAYFRRGEANFQMKKYKEGREDFKKAIKINPSNKPAGAKARQCQDKIQAETNKEKALYGGMFQKFAQQDEVAKAKKVSESGDAAKNDDTAESNDTEAAVNGENEVNVNNEATEAS